MKKCVIAATVLLTLSSFFMFLGCDSSGGGNTNDQVLLIGDSIFALSGEIANELERLSGESYRDHTVSGAEMEGGFVRAIPRQYADARRENSNIRTVIMDGGGNDIQIGAATVCTSGTVTAACRSALQGALNAADELFSDMRSQGVQNIIYMNYFYIMDNRSKPAFDWMHDQMAALVSKHNGIIVDPMPYMSDRLIGPDRIHPTDEGSRMLANLIWDAMEANCIENACGGGSSSSSSSSSSNGGGCR